MLSLLGAITAITAAVLVAVVIWLDLHRTDAIDYVALAVRVIVIGGFLMVLAWMLWKVGKSMGNGPRRPTPDTKA